MQATLPRPNRAEIPVARPQTRLVEPDILKGFAIILVVYMHGWFGPWDGVPYHEVFVIHATHLFGHGAVPVFLFLSGMLLGRSEPSGVVDFAVRKLRRIYVPLLFWMFVALTYRIWNEGGLDRPMVADFFEFGISGQYYYLAVLLMLMPTFYVVSRQWWAGSAWIPVVAFFVNLAAITYYQGSVVEGDFATFAYRNPLVWVFFFSFGFYAGHRWRDFAWTDRLFYPALGALIVLGAIYFITGERSDYPVSYFGVQVFLFSCVGMVFYPGLVRRIGRFNLGLRLMEPLRRLSRYSFAIYLAHQPLFIGWLTTNTLNSGRIDQDYLALVMALFVVGFTGTLAFVLAIGHIAPRFSETFVGIEPETALPPAPSSL